MNMYVGPNKYAKYPQEDTTDKLFPLPETDDQGTQFVYKPHWPEHGHSNVCHSLFSLDIGAVLHCNGVADALTRTHTLKADRTPFESLMNGTKKAEVRYNDRDFRGGDVLIMRETLHSNLEMKTHGLELIYTGRIAAYRVTHIQRGYGLPTDMVVMSVEFMCAYPMQLFGMTVGNYTADARE